MKYFILKHTSRIFGRPLFLSTYNIPYIDYICEPLFTKYRNEITHVLEFDSEGIDFLAQQERAFPGNLEFLESGYFKTMLKRYLFAGSSFCRGKRVLDSCSGLGWGTSILSLFAKKITAYDLEPRAIEFCRKTWGEDKISWVVDDALKPKVNKKNKHDVAVAMETIEHFDKDEGLKYLTELKNSLNSRGILIGTSSFPSDRESADDLCAKNKYHHYVYTKSEMDELLRTLFDRHVIINNWMFIAVKSKFDL